MVCTVGAEAFPPTREATPSARKHGAAGRFAAERGGEGKFGEESCRRAVAAVALAPHSGLDVVGDSAAAQAGRPLLELSTARADAAARLL